jgi:hypothetical protein
VYIFLDVYGTYGPPVFAPCYSATGLAAKVWTNSNEHSMNFKFLWVEEPCIEIVKV